MSEPDRAEIERVKREADLLYPKSAVDTAVARMAGAITARLEHARPILLVTMTGGIVPAALLLPHLDFPLQVDYLHLTRYGNATSGGEIEWIRRPSSAVTGRSVLIVDDLLDHGLTLQTAVQECFTQGAEAVLTAVLVVKEIAARPGLQQTDFFALTTPDRYLFGYGMDYKTYWRNGPGIYAVRGM
ncbi:MAG: hypoxanthine-guanine phosphoribosyltransferase [Gammaproteobacteria bacterium]